MRLRRIAFANLRVRCVRTAFLALGIIVAVTAVAGLATLNAAMEEQLRRELVRTGTRVVIAPYAEELTLSYNGIAVAAEVSSKQAYLPESALEAIGMVPAGAVLVTAPKLVGVVKAEKEDLSRSLIAVGVNFAAEKALKPWYSLVGGPPGPQGVVLGSDLAAELKLIPGDKIRLNEREFTVDGSLAETGEADDRLIFLDLSVAREVLGVKKELSLIELRIDAEGLEFSKEMPQVSSAAGVTAAEVAASGGNGNKRQEGVNAALRELSLYLESRLPGTKVAPVQGSNSARVGLIEGFTSFARLVEVVIVFIAALIVLTTMMSSINERRREIGVFRTLGFRRSHILKIILTEAAMVSLVGGVAGYGVGLAAASLARPYLAPGVVMQWDPWLPVLSLALALAVGVGAASYPAWLASRLDPSEALRSI